MQEAADGGSCAEQLARARRLRSSSNELAAGGRACQSQQRCALRDLGGAGWLECCCGRAGCRHCPPAPRTRPRFACTIPGTPLLRSMMPCLSHLHSGPGRCAVPNFLHLYLLLATARQPVGQRRQQRRRRRATAASAGAPRPQGTRARIVRSAGLVAAAAVAGHPCSAAGEGWRVAGEGRRVGVLVYGRHLCSCSAVQERQ